jgi:hypothetical protein
MERLVVTSVRPTELDRSGYRNRRPYPIHGPDSGIEPIIRGCEMMLVGIPTVYIIDDDSSIRESIQELLKLVGLHSECFETSVAMNNTASKVNVVRAESAVNWYVPARYTNLSSNIE